MAVQNRIKVMEIKQFAQRKFQKFVKVNTFAIKGFRQDRCDLRASSLTLITIISIVPILALAFGIAKGFGFHEFLKDKVLSMAVGQEEIIQTFFTFASDYLEKTKGGLLAVIGVLILGYYIIKLMGLMENSFNKIWGVIEDRPLMRKFTDYIALLITAAILLIFSSSGNIFITAFLERFISWLSIPDILKGFIDLGFKLIPLFPIWILFIFFYIFLPNKRIDIKAATAGGIIAGTIFQITQVAYLKMQIGVANANAIYGSFAILFLFSVWLQISWSIFLFGAEIAYSWENADALETQDLDYRSVSIRMRKLIILRLVLLCVKRFANKQSPPTNSDIAAQMKIPLRIVKLLLEKLIARNILLEVNLKDEALGYVPAHDIECLSLMDVIKAYEENGEKQIQVGGTMEFEALEASIDAFSQAAVESKENRNFKDI